MLSRRETEDGEEDEDEQREDAPCPAHERTVGLPQLVREEHHGHEEARVAAEDEIPAVERVTEHGPLVDEDGFDVLWRVVGRAGSAVRSRTGKQRPPSHNPLERKERTNPVPC